MNQWLISADELHSLKGSKILDGGLSAWHAAGFSVTDDGPTSSEGDFEAVENSSLVVDHHWVRKHLTNRRITLIDSREAPRYLGREEPIDPAKGHIPGAVNAPWQRVTNEAGFARPQEQQKKIWQALPIADNPVVYCGSGITACVNLLSLSLAGMVNARLYAGSWSDWCSYPANPIEPPRAEPPELESTQIEPP
ncbi:MAG: sulfurtransferase [Porticoccus sp.]|nr:sulfurtransferase [Porticoccus sp.]